jgi:hypothetical protein
MTFGNEAGVFVSGGSVSGGGFLLYGLGQGLALLGGISYAKESYPDAGGQTRRAKCGLLDRVGAQRNDSGAASVRPLEER